MRRFFVHHQAVSGTLATLSESESHHILHVLRLQQGDQVELFDEQGTVYVGTLSVHPPHSVTVQILSQKSLPEQKAPQLHLYQGLLKGKKMDFLVQKSTELGVHSFHPLQTRYSEQRSPDERQLLRWQRVMLESCKQCKRSTPMVIREAESFMDTDFSGCTNRVLLWEGDTSHPLSRELLSGPGPICLAVGPEGGFHPDEIARAESCGFHTVSLGPRILRAETASLSVISIVQFLCGALDPVTG